MECRIDGVSFVLGEPYDFGFLREYGRVFKVFDDQDSGNICFGMEKGREKLFVKFAGARTKRGSIAPEQAVRNLSATAPIYRDLRHGNLIELVEAAPMGEGYGMVFKWAEGECMGRMYPQSRARFMASDVETRLRVFSDIQMFFAHVVEKGYVAIDFYDGSVLYDFASGHTTICDIDFFRKRPCFNDMGRMWGSSRFQAPEEYQLGAAIDEVTNVYTLGATAFALFSDYAREAGAWPLGRAAFAVAARATQADREQRQRSVREFMEDWRRALL